MAGQLLVEMRRVTKRFPGVVANDQVGLGLVEGEIHALLGENGSGKSTLMSILSGLYRPDEGEIYIRGQKVHFKSPRDSINAGIGMVHQHFRLVEPFTVAQNVILGARRMPFFLKMEPLEEKVRKLSEGFGLRVDPRARVWQLSVGERQRVEIIKLLYRETDVLIMDEPTAVLSPGETRDLFTILRKIAGSGKAVVVITHKLREVLEIADRVTVLRGGRSITTLEGGELSEQALARAMIGRDLPAGMAKETEKAGKPVLVLEEVCAGGEGGLPSLRGVSLEVREKEIVGIAGVAGNGQKELAGVITGLRKVSGGRVLIGGEDVTGLSPRRIIDLGVSHVPEDRLGAGLV
ncbi:MAG: ATP-binding cassette domain-containing protein, partial [Firmicutes bacterium]|nr:ATP-binding cassette domain-containing protein [Bacillota bacterium]